MPEADLAQTIRQRRRDLSLTQEDLARLSGTSTRFVREVETGKPTVRLDKLEAVLGALGLRLEVVKRTR